MAMNYSVIFLSFCLASIISQGLARRSTSIHPPKPSKASNLHPPKPSKASYLQCWAALFDLEACYTEFLRAAQNFQIDTGIGPTCCRAGERMNAGCWPALFPFNPYFPIQLKLYCFRYWVPNPPKPSVASPPPVVAPTPEPTADIPIDEGRVALPLHAPSSSIKGPFMKTSPTIKGPFMNTPIVSPIGRQIPSF